MIQSQCQATQTQGLWRHKLERWVRLGLATVVHHGDLGWAIRVGYLIIALASIAVAASLVLGLAIFFAPETRIDIEPASIKADSGHAFRFPINVRPTFPYELPTDTAGIPEASQLIMRENGIALRPRHALHDEIRVRGGGAFSHWNGNLFFSTSDNSDPRSNGRTYSIESPTRVHAGIIWFVVILDIISIGMMTWYEALFRSNLMSLAVSHRGLLFYVGFMRIMTPMRRVFDLISGPYGFAAISFLIVIYINYIQFSGRPLFLVLTPDSMGYVGSSAIRTPGYPFLIAFIRSVFGDLDWLVPVQINLLLISYIMLGLGMRAIFGSWLVAEAVTALLAIDTNVQSAAWQMMSDAPFAAMVTLHVAMIFFLLHHFTRTRACCAGLFLVLAILVRPAGYSLLAGIPFLMVLMRAHWRGILLWTGGTTLAGLLAVSAFNAVTVGTFSTQSFGGVALVGHVAYMIQSDPASRYPELSASIDALVAPARAQIESAHIPREHWLVSTNLYDTLLWFKVLPEIDKYLKQTRAGKIAGPNEWAYKENTISQTLAIEAILRDPWEYVVHVLSNYYGMWESTFNYAGPVSGFLNQFYQSNQSLIDNPWFASLPLARNLYRDPLIAAWFKERQEDFSVSDMIWEEFTSKKETIVVFLFAASLATFYFLMHLRRLPPAMLGLIFLSFSIHMYYMMVASCIAAVGRYAAAFEPVLLTLALGILVSGIRSLVKPWGELMSSVVVSTDLIRMEPSIRATKEP